MIFIWFTLAISGAAAWLVCGWLGYRISVTRILREYPITFCSLPMDGMMLQEEKIADRIKQGKAEILLGPVGLLSSLAVYGWKYGISIPSNNEIHQLAWDYWGEWHKERGYTTDYITDRPDYKSAISYLNSRLSDN